MMRMMMWRDRLYIRSVEHNTCFDGIDKNSSLLKRENGEGTLAELVFFLCKQV